MIWDRLTRYDLGGGIAVNPPGIKEIFYPGIERPSPIEVILRIQGEMLFAEVDKIKKVPQRRIGLLSGWRFDISSVYLRGYLELTVGFP